MSIYNAPTIKTMTEDEVIHLFLRSELNSTKFGPRLRQQLQKIGIGDELITAANLNDELQNKLRREALEYRHYITRETDSLRNLFFGFPYDITWRMVSVTCTDLLDEASYINGHEFWLEVTHGTRKPRAAVAAFESGELPDDPNIERFIAIKNTIEEGKFNAMPPMIFVTDNIKCINLEGHGRLTGLAWANCGQPTQPFNIILGHSPNLSQWRHY